MFKISAIKYSANKKFKFLSIRIYYKKIMEDEKSQDEL